MEETEAKRRKGTCPQARDLETEPSVQPPCQVAWSPTIWPDKSGKVGSKASWGLEAASLISFLPVDVVDEVLLTSPHVPVRDTEAECGKAPVGPRGKAVSCSY
jgi:hypothetical protein